MHILSLLLAPWNSRSSTPTTTRLQHPSEHIKWRDRKVTKQIFPAGLMASHCVTSKWGGPWDTDKETDCGIKQKRERIEKGNTGNSGTEPRAVWASRRPARGGRRLALLARFKNTQRKWEGNENKETERGRTWWDRVHAGDKLPQGKRNRAVEMFCGVRGLVWHCNSDMGADRLGRGGR